MRFHHLPLRYAEADVIEICRELFPVVGNVIVCDTSFHFNMPEKAHRYALPRDVVDMPRP